MKKKRLIVIGNGFDLFHKMPSKYSDFKKYLEEEQEDEFLKGISEYIEFEDDLWSDFEYALGYLDEEALREKYEDELVSYASDEWRDSYNHSYPSNIEEDLIFSNNISILFTSWIKSLNTNVKRLLRKKYINNKNYYMNFNYTDVLEKVYLIDENRILYIHGKALRGDKLITGHNNYDFSIYKKPVFRTQEEAEAYEEANVQDFREQVADDTIKNYFKTTYKNVRKIIINNKYSFNKYKGIKRVYVLGHSISEVDIEYFKEINKYVSPSCKWIVSFYESNDKPKMITNLNAVGIYKIEFISLKDLQKRRTYGQ